MIHVKNRNEIRYYVVDTTLNTAKLKNRTTGAETTIELHIDRSLFNVPVTKIMWIDSIPEGMVIDPQCTYLEGYKPGAYLIWNSDYEGTLQLGTPGLQVRTYNNEKTIKVYGE